MDPRSSSAFCAVSWRCHVQLTSSKLDWPLRRSPVVVVLFLVLTVDQTATVLLGNHVATHTIILYVKETETEGSTIKKNDTQRRCWVIISFLTQKVYIYIFKKKKKNWAKCHGRILISPVPTCNRKQQDGAPFPPGKSGIAKQKNPSI